MRIPAGEERPIVMVEMVKTEDGAIDAQQDHPKHESSRQVSVAGFRDSVFKHRFMQLTRSVCGDADLGGRPPPWV